MAPEYDPPLPVENGVEELHDTPSIEADPDAAITERHQMRDTLPHVEIGVPSFEGIEPTPRATPQAAFAKLPGLAGKLPSLKNMSARAAGGHGSATALGRAGIQPAAPWHPPTPPCSSACGRNWPKSAAPRTA